MANSSISELFGSMVFGDGVMKERLPRDIYNALKPCRCDKSRGRLPGPAACLGRKCGQ